MAGRFQTPNEQFLDENGDPLAAGELAFFESGTTTPLDTYSDDDLTVPNTNPVILDGAGRAGDIFLTDADYKVTLSKADGTVVWTADPVRATSEKSTTVRTVSTTTELGESDDGRWIAADATSGGFVITLPLAADVGNGYRVTIQKVDTGSNVVTVDGKNSDRINGATTFDLTAEFAGATFQCDGSTWYALIPERTPLPRGYIDGWRIEYISGTETRLNPGKLRNSADTRNATLSASLTKKINEPWAQGNNQGGLFSGSVAADTTYHACAIQNNASFAVDWGWDTDPGGANTPVGWTFLRRVGSIKTDGSSELYAVDQWGDQFTYRTIADKNQTVSGVSTSTNNSLHVMDFLPMGVQVAAFGFVRSEDNASNTGAGVYSATTLDNSGTATRQQVSASGGAVSTVVTTGMFSMCVTDTGAQLALSRKSGSDNPIVTVTGYIDRRGKDS